MSRQKGAYKRAKAAKVEAVGASAQGGKARVAGEGRGGGTGGTNVVEEISDVVVANEVERCEGPELIGKHGIHNAANNGTTVFISKLIRLVPQCRHEVLKVAVVSTAATKTLIRPPACAFTLPVEVGETDIHDRHDA
ncbi:phenylalanine-tRNA ligase subunit alpha [Babesia caballi]|uniref:Phenylalanine-tRNA ligase subunit alpha n=1 Tax=Babesia caballi TaxID=5871 RepID=A0AAV4LV68_BABCB|nr:phenylalanine-tRNA ligase subunit alpha [Babesia caballi]